MKVSIELSPEYSEPYAIIYADKITDSIQRTLDIFGSNESPITAFKNENDIVILQPKEIYMVREHRADRGAEDFQSGPAVRGAADDLQRLGGSHVHCGDVQVVRIGVIGAGHNLADDNAPKAAFHGFDLLEAFDFEADVRQDFSDLFGRKIGRDITFEPVIRNIHIVKF